MADIPLNLVNKNDVDVSRIFEAYIAFMGDTGKVAAALDVDEFIVKNLATVENWGQKLKQWHSLGDGDPRDVQVQINRAINFVQSHRLRAVLDKLVGKLHKMTPEELIDALTVNTKYGSEVKVRALTDLAKAAEAVQLMTQRALGDTDAERPDQNPNTKGSQIMLSVAAAMQAAENPKLDSAGVIKEQLNPPNE